MPTVTKDIALYAGEDVVLTDTIFQADGVTPQNITGWLIRFAFHALGGGADLVTKTVGAGIVLVVPASGLLTVTLLAADTAALAPGIYSYRVERYDAGADAILSAGALMVKAR